MKMKNLTNESLFISLNHASISGGRSMTKLAKKRKTEWDQMMKRSIYEATMTVLNENGFDGLRMDLVAKAAEVATGTLYNYFRDKDELLLHVIDTRFEPIRQAFSEIRDSHRSPPEKFEDFVRAHLNFVAEYRSLVIIITTAEGLSRAVKKGANAKREKVRRILAEIIDQGINQGLFRPFDSMLAARLILGAINGLVEAIINNSVETMDFEKNISECMKLFFSGLLAEQ
jgi:AcrR family transcriptional regulator